MGKRRKKGYGTLRETTILHKGVQERELWWRVVGVKREIVNGKKKVVEKNLQPVCRLEIKIYFPSCLQNVSQGYFI